MRPLLDWSNSILSINSSPLRIGDGVSKEVSFDAESIKRYATLADDLSPYHHDEKFAASSRFGGLIASGTQTFAMMFGAAASFMATIGPSLGLESTARFRRPMRAGDVGRIEWRVTSIEDKPGLNGSIITLEGRLVRGDGELAVIATNKSLLLPPGTQL